MKYNTSDITQETMALIYADAYLRYSSKNQDELSIEYQIDDVKAYCEKHGIVINKWYIDRAKSGKKVAGRDEFYEYISSVKKKTASPNLIVWATNRAFRNSYESHKYRKQLRENNITLISVTQHIDEKTSSGRLMTSILSDIDQYKSEEIADHVTAALRSLVKRNPRVIVGGVPILGYKAVEWQDGDVIRKVYEINEEEAKFVRTMFNDFLDGKSCFSIAKWLNFNGLKTRRNSQFIYSSVRQMLKNDFYIGTRKHDDLTFTDAVPAIIDRKTFDAVQKKFRDEDGDKPKSRVQRKTGRVYGLTGKIICELCGSEMCGKGNSAYQYYVCTKNENRKECTCKRIRKEAVENYVLQQIHDYYFDGDTINQTANNIIRAIGKMPKAKEDKKSLLKKKETLLKEMAELVQMKMNGEIIAEVFTMMNKQKNDELAMLELDLINAGNDENAITVDSVANELRRILSAAQGTDEERKALFDVFVESVVVNNEDIVVTLTLSTASFSHNAPFSSPVVGLCKKIDRNYFNGRK